MNDHHPDLGHLLDQAAADYHPVADAARFERLLVRRHGRRRGAVVLFGAAASLALMGGAAVAFRADPHQRLTPAGSSADLHVTTSAAVEPDATKPPSTETGDTKPSATEPPVTEPAVTEPAATWPPEPVKATTTTVKKVEPPTTKPPTTEPPTTKPPTTEPPTTKPPTTEPAVAWSANQVYGSCDASPPYDVFYGTGTPGAKVVIEAAYGRAVGKIGADGHWEIRIEFPEAPVGEPFTVWVVSGDHVSEFVFTRLAPA